MISKNESFEKLLFSPAFKLPLVKISYLELSLNFEIYKNRGYIFTEGAFQINRTAYSNLAFETIKEKNEDYYNTLSHYFSSQ
jgi:hypothetical protein